MLSTYCILSIAPHQEAYICDYLLFVTWGDDGCKQLLSIDTTNLVLFKNKQNQYLQSDQVLSFHFLLSDTIFLLPQCFKTVNIFCEYGVFTLPIKVRLVKAMVFPVVMYGCENCTIKKAEYQTIDAFKVWCWRRLLRVT